MQPLDVPVHVEPADQPVQEPRQQHDLERQREQRPRSTDASGRFARRPAASRRTSSAALRGEQVDERQHAPLRQHREREQQQQRREQVDELQVEGRHRHAQAPSSRLTSMPEHREQERGAEELGRAEDPHLRRHRLDQRQPAPAERELRASSGERARAAEPVVAAVRDAPRQEQREADARVVEQLERRRPLDQREVPRRVLEHHRLVDHRELEVRRRIVDRDARVLREQHHRERDAGEREARIDRELACARASRRSSAATSTGRDQRGGEQHHQQRRLGEEADDHLAPRAERAERGADVHRRERDEHAREREQADQRDRVGGLRERQVGRERRNDRRRAAPSRRTRRRASARNSGEALLARPPHPCGTACGCVR